MTVLNIEKNDDSPLFLGEDLGLQTYLSPRYHRLYELFKEQRENLWVETEVPLAVDQKQWATLPEEIKEITILNLANQVMMDSLLGRSPMQCLAPFVSNEEYEIMLLEWQRMEGCVHSVTYSHIIQSVFPNPEEILEQIKQNKVALKRLEKITQLFDELYKASITKQYEEEILGQEWGEEKLFELKKLIFKTIVAIYILESNQFNASFSMTFGLAQQDILPGFAAELQLIARDELSIHTRMSEAVISIQKQAWPDVWEAIQPEVLQLFEEVHQNEVYWGEYVLSGNRKIVGLNAELVKEYLQFVCTNSMRFMGLEPPEHIRRESNPIPWIEKWIDMASVQPSPQEQPITNYKVGKYNSDIDEDALDIDFDL